MPSQRKTLLYSVYSIYFICGLAQCFEGLFFPEFKARFNLTYTEEMYIMFAKNIPFVLFSIAIGHAARKFGLRICLAIALLLFALGTFLLIPGLRSGSFGTILSAFFIIGLGFNVELVAGNPSLAALGEPEGASSRLNTGNALGAIAQIIAPLFVVAFIPDHIRSIDAKMPYIEKLFVITGLALLGMAVYSISTGHGAVIEKPGLPGMTDGRKKPFVLRIIPGKGETDKISIWRQPRVLLGVVALFLVLGFEACLFGFFRNFAEDKGTAGMSAHQSQGMFTVYFAVFACGRVSGSYIQKRVRPALTLAFSLTAAILLLFLVILTSGLTAILAVTAIGFFASIFFPTLFSIAIEGLSDQASYASGLLTMGFLGGAVLPVLQGRLADLVGLKLSFSIGLIPYSFALFYLWKSANFGKPDRG